MGKKKASQAVPEIVKREAVFEAMTPDLRKVAEKIENLNSKAARGTVIVAYDIGTEVRRVIHEEGKYGSNAVVELAKYLDMSETTLYDYHNMTKVYPRGAVEKMATKKTATGSHISLGHILAIIKVNKAEGRKKLWGRVFGESLSVGQLQTEISAGFDKRNTRSGGRKPARPTSPLAAAQQVFENFQMVKNRMPVWKESLLDEVDQMEPEKIDTILLERLNKGKDQAVEVQGELDNFIAGLEKNIKRVEKIIEKKKEEEAKAEEANKAEARQLEGKGRTRRPAAAV